jgi:hypothetical protein
MSNIKFIDPLFNTRYFKKLFNEQINPLLHNSDYVSTVHSWWMIDLLRPPMMAETQSTSILKWTPGDKFLNETLYTSTFHTDINHKVLVGNGHKSVPVCSVGLTSIADKDEYYNVCKNYNFNYLWFSIHIGPHETPMHIDEDSPIRYVQCISKNHKQSDWSHDNNKLILNEGDAFLFDPKFKHEIVTEKGCESIFLIAQCIEHTVDEFNV